LNRNCILLAVGALVSTAPVFASVRNDNFAPITYLYDDSEVIGQIKIGFLCFPNGSLRLRDLKLPRDGQLAEKALATYSSMSVLSGQNYQFQGKVESMALSICVAGLNLGEKKPKGKGKIAITWTQSVALSGEVVRSSMISSEFEINNHDPRRDALALEQALLENFSIFLKSGTSQ
jgi:hypothetical protein